MRTVYLCVPLDKAEYGEMAASVGCGDGKQFSMASNALHMGGRLGRIWKAGQGRSIMGKMVLEIGVSYE